MKSIVNNTTMKTSRRKFLKNLSTSVAAYATLGSKSWGNTMCSSIENPNEYKVFSEGKIGRVQLKNRLIKAATLERAGQNGFPGDIYIQTIENLASGGTGLVITGAMAVAQTVVSETQIYIYDDKFISGLEKIAETVHLQDKANKVFAQIVHVDNSKSPSGINWSGKPTQGDYSIDQINDLIKCFSESIVRAKAAGFDGVELNAHYQYFLSSFLSAQTNKRADDYGGSMENRVRLVKEIVQQARIIVGDDFPIIIKLNCDDSFSLTTKSEYGTNIENFPLLAIEIEKAGFDAIELSGNTMIRKDINTLEKESYFENYANNLNIQIPVILTGGNRSLDKIEDIFKKDKIDFFGFARPLIREPDLPKRWQEYGNKIKSECISCNSCLAASGPLRCMQKS